MRALGQRGGFILFGLILVVVVMISLAAYRVTGPMGTEGGYNPAVGLAGPKEGSGNGWFGFSIEGDPLLYGIILAALGGICVLAYLRSRREGHR